jgi:hypothetical protein
MACQRRDRSLRPLVALLSFAFVADVAERLLLVLVITPRQPHALTAYHLSNGLVTGWPCGVCTLAWWAFQGPQKTNGPELPEPRESMAPGAKTRDLPRLHLAPIGERQGSLGSIAVKVIPALWLAANAYLVLRIPLEPEPIQTFLHRVELAAVALAALPIMLGWSWRRERPATAALFLVGLELVIATVGPFARGQPYADWYVAAAAYGLGFALLAGLLFFWYRRPVGR